MDLSNKPYLALTLYPGDSASVKGDMPSVAAIKYFSSDGQNCIEKKDFSNFTIKGDVNRPVFPEFYTGCEPGADQVKEGTALLNVEYSDNGQERDKVFLDLGWNTYMRSIIQENIGTAFFNANSTYYKLTKTFITNSPPSNPSLPTLNEEGNLCEIIREKSIYIDCSQFKNQTFEIHPRAFFSNGRWNDENVARVLNTLGKAISESGSSYTAVIRGYASSNELSCKTVAQRLAGWPNENFWLKKLEGVKFSIREKSELKEVSCEQGDTSKDGNYLLSFARAAWAAGILQKASSLTTTEKSNVAIEMIQPLSAQFSLVGNNRNDRRVSIRLQRYVLDSMTTD